MAPAGMTAQQRIGGFLDGRAMAARFNRPVGVAVGGDGSVYVADEFNFVIRKISNGTVTTFAGTPGTRGNRDGKGKEAQFNQPDGIAIDAGGNLYVADRGVGVRKIDAGGTVTTLPVPMKNPDICGISARGTGKNLLLAYTDGQSINLMAGASHKAVNFTDQAEPWEDGAKTVGFACGVVALDRDSVVVTDVRTNTVRFVRFPLDGAIGSETMTRVLVSGRRSDSFIIGGYANGSIVQAMADVPRGITIESNGTIIFADSGNRRIRSIDDVNPRGPIDIGADGTLAVPSVSASDYRVVFIGNSASFHNVMWQESIPGQLEAGLYREFEAKRLPRCPRVIPYRFSGDGISDTAQFITTYYGDGEADVVVFLIDRGTINHEMQTHTALQAGNVWRAAIAGDFAKLKRDLGKAGTALLMVPMPDAHAASPLEMVQHDQYSLLAYYNFYDVPGSTVDEFFHGPGESYSTARDIENVTVSSGARTLKLLTSMERAEELPTRVPFFYTEDYHETPAAQTWIGKQIALELALWQPWKVKP
ncbi:MAG TPA: hypothetical protein VFO29_09650 [Candidatus Rubrimentiphilum sp.]|nr:hypothetical protein [Candidatus Rubrimentiphilum sp.]